MKYNNDNIVDAQWWNITFTQILHLSKFLVTICLSLLSINHSLLVDLDQSEEWAAVSAWKKIFYWVSHARRKKQVHTWKFDFFFFFLILFHTWIENCHLPLRASLHMRRHCCLLLSSVTLQCVCCESLLWCLCACHSVGRKFNRGDTFWPLCS